MPSRMEQISELLLEEIAERFNKEELATQGLEFSDNFPEMLEKLVILHIRTWKMEDEIGITVDPVKHMAIKKKLDFCFKVKRPQLLAAIGCYLDAYVDENHPKNNRRFAEENVKHYAGDHTDVE